jgi:hypothetical protein
LELELIVSLAWIVIIEDELVGSVSVVNDSVIQVLESSLEHSESSPSFLFDGDDFSNFALDVDWLTELELELELEIIHVL